MSAPLNIYVPTSNISSYSTLLSSSNSKGSTKQIHLTQQGKLGQNNAGAVIQRLLSSARSDKTNNSSTHKLQRKKSKPASQSPEPRAQIARDRDSLEHHRSSPHETRKCTHNTRAHHRAKRAGSERTRRTRGQSSAAAAAAAPDT